MSLRERLLSTGRDESGATTVEYGILAAGIGLVLVAAGPALEDAFGAALNAILEGMLGA